MRVRLFGEGVVTGGIRFRRQLIFRPSPAAMIRLSIPPISNPPVIYRSQSKSRIYRRQCCGVFVIGTCLGADSIGSASKGVSYPLCAEVGGNKNALMVLTASGFSVKSDTIVLHARKDSGRDFRHRRRTDSVVVCMTGAAAICFTGYSYNNYQPWKHPQSGMCLSLGNFSLSKRSRRSVLGGTSAVRVRFDGRWGIISAPSHPLLEKRCGRVNLQFYRNVVPSAPTVLRYRFRAAAIGEIIEVTVADYKYSRSERSKSRRN